MRRQLWPSLGLLLAVALCGCAAAPKSVIVLLPEGGKASGEVTVSNAHGSQVLNQSFHSVEIAGAREQPSAPVVAQSAEVKEAFAPVLAATPAPPVRYMLYFAFGCPELLPVSRSLLPEIAEAIQKRSPAQLSVVGHADTLGPADYNHRLGLLRATAVAELLEQQGGAPAGIETSSRGESDLLVPTADEIAEPRNRRVEVTIR